MEKLQTNATNGVASKAQPSGKSRQIEQLVDLSWTSGGAELA